MSKELTQQIYDLNLSLIKPHINPKLHEMLTQCDYKEAKEIVAATLEGGEYNKYLDWFYSTLNEVIEIYVLADMDINYNIED